MRKDVMKIIQTMDVKKDRETALLKAHEIYQLGPGALEMLVDIGTAVNQNEAEVATRNRYIRAVIFSLAKFAEKRLFRKPRLRNNAQAVHLLCDFSEQGFNSARTTLYTIGLTDADILKDRLMLLPEVDTREQDREITLNEAVEEIQIAQLLSPVKRIKNQVYVIGNTDKHSHEICKTGKNRFTYRIRRIGWPESGHSFQTE